MWADGNGSVKEMKYLLSNKNRDLMKNNEVAAVDVAGGGRPETHIFVILIISPMMRMCDA